MKQPIFFLPFFQEKLWGGEKLKNVFHYDIPSQNIGECWAISAHNNGQSIVANGQYKGHTLGELWDSHRDLFGNIEGEKFPLLIKILDANEDLSVQVHPSDSYAEKFENGELGKTECWYIIDCHEGAELILGHNAQSKEELVQLIEEGNWELLLRRIQIKKGDFLYIPSGTIHALCKETLVLEIQQNSDATYRLYDYDRRDSKGNVRELHLEKSKDVITVPNILEQLPYQIETAGSAKVIKFIENNCFTVYKWDINGKATFNQRHLFLLCSVIEGKGILIQDEQQHSLNKGMHFLLPYGFGEFQLDGKMEIIVSHV